jgi:ubiquinone/menaquinone biosynthesis C-methylase UbiE
MNAFHRWYCNSDRWARRLQEILPGVLQGFALGDDALELGPGPGITTDWLRERIARLTVVEINPSLAASLRERMEGTNVTVIEGDASALELPDASFDSVLSFTMLHHVPKDRQQPLLSEACRVLKPGGRFVGTDSTPGFVWNLYHLFDDRNPVNPDTFGSRLALAGFMEVKVTKRESGFSFRGRKPAV